MSKKHHGGPAPIPPANRSHGGPAHQFGEDEQTANQDTTGDTFQEQDPQRRLGDYTTEGEHARQQPTDRNDGTRHSQ